MSSNPEGLTSPLRWWNGLTRALKRRHVRRAIGQWASVAAVVAVAAAFIFALTAIDRINKGPGSGLPVPVPSQSAIATGGPTGGDQDPMTAGVPKGLYLKPVFHDLKITKDGTVVEGLDVHGRIIIKANDVTIRNTMIRGSDTGSRNGLIDMTRDFTGLVVEDSEIFATVESPWVNGIIGDHYTLRHVNIHNVIDEAQITGDDVTIENSWFHDNLHYENDPNQDGTPSHDDSVEMFGGKNIVIRNNVFDDVWNANLQLSQVIGPISDVTFEGNRVNTGFCSINLSQKKLPPIERIVIKDNTFGKDTRHPNCAILRPSTTVPETSNNVFVDGTPVTGYVPG